MCNKDQRLTTFVESKVYIDNNGKEYTFVKDTSVYGNTNEHCLVFSNTKGCMYLKKDGMNISNARWMVEEKPVEIKKYTNIYNDSFGGRYISVDEALAARTGKCAGVLEQVWCDGKLISVNLLPA